jgi:hypothetical protein
MAAGEKRNSPQAIGSGVARSYKLIEFKKTNFSPRSVHELSAYRR